MGQRTEYTPGTFSWTDLSTTDQAAAKSFYAELFGWTYTDNPVGDGIFYSMAGLGDQHVAAIATQPKQQLDAGVPPSWNSYITVQSADETLARAKELGATVHADAFDVMEAGRMGVIQDPQGAYFLVWEPKAHVGAGLVNAPGALAWNELATTDMDAATGFYSDLFGWTVTPFEGMEMPYSAIRNSAEHSNGGIRPTMPPESPPVWLVYFAVEELEAALAKVGDLGGNVLVGSTDIGMAKIAVVQDPQGAVFALYHGQLEP
jgi:predicted enzyme related to lactoylglutathione lyase